MSRPRLTILFCFLIGSLLSACASTDSSSETAWARYLEFEQALQHQGLKLDYEPFFSDHAYRDVQEAAPEDVRYIKEMLAYPLYFSETYSHAEKTVGTRRCLLVNGKLTQGEAASLAIEFIVEDGLKMNDANLLFVESEEGVSEAPVCPEETRV